ncbi:MAG: hypothetical protein V9G98_09995 [Candidatus Competibacter sp.]
MSLPSLLLLSTGQKYSAAGQFYLSAYGATGTQYRLHLALDLVRLDWAYSLVTDEHTGEQLAHYPL